MDYGFWFESVKLSVRCCSTARGISYSVLSIVGDISRIVSLFATKPHCKHQQEVKGS